MTGIRLALAVLVITGWFMVALWFALSVAEITVSHQTGCAVAAVQEITCSD